jgi:hypothetical protein
MKAGAEINFIGIVSNFRLLFSRRYGDCDTFHRYQNSDKWQVADS